MGVRIIEFRAYSKSLKRMLSFEHLKEATKGMVDIANAEIQKRNINYNKLAPYGLFLPLEGDIIKARHNEYLYIVKYEDCGFVIEDKWGSRIKQHQDSVNRLECEIVGNIFDNPELLGEEA